MNANKNNLNGRPCLIENLESRRLMSSAGPTPTTADPIPVTIEVDHGHYVGGGLGLRSSQNTCEVET